MLQAMFTLKINRAAFTLLAGLFLASATHAQVNDFRPNTETISPKVRQAIDFVELGLKYEHAEGLAKDFAKAHDLYCTAARLDYSGAYLRLGWMYANGRGVPRNDSIASSLFKRAASLGDEMGARLAEMIRGDKEDYPPCLTTKTPPSYSQSASNDSQSKELPRLPALPKALSFSQLTSADKIKFAGSVTLLSKEFKLDPRLVMAVMRAESNFDPLARSSKGAQGLMQLIPETAERFAVKDITDPFDNIRGGMAYLKWLLSFFRGDVMLSLAAYNAGEKTIEKFGGVPPYTETMVYVQRIRSAYPVDFHPYDDRAASFRTNRKK
jgi:TPR repeat protein